MKRFVLLLPLCLLVAISPVRADVGHRLFLEGWTLNGAPITLPCSFSLPDVICDSTGVCKDSLFCFENHFTWDGDARHKLFVEFEGISQSVEILFNGNPLGCQATPNTAFGYDLTPYLYIGDNQITLLPLERMDTASVSSDSIGIPTIVPSSTGTPLLFQRVWLHETDLLHQTLPLYASMGTVGPSVYADQFDIPNCSANFHYTTEVQNDDSVARTFYLRAEVYDAQGALFTTLVEGMPHTLQPGEKATVFMSSREEGVHFWDRGRGYLYTVSLKLVESDNPWAAGDIPATDRALLHTGFRKTEFVDGCIYLNDSLLNICAQTLETCKAKHLTGSNLPDWLRDYYYTRMVGRGEDVVCWMGGLPTLRDVESGDRTGLFQLLPLNEATSATDAPLSDSASPEVRDLLLRLRNHPSVLCCGEPLPVLLNEALSAAPSPTASAKAGKPHRLTLTAITPPSGFQANGYDVALLRVKAFDKDGSPCSLDSCRLDCSIKGPAIWGDRWTEEDGQVFLIRSTDKPGTVVLKVKAPGIRTSSLKLKTISAVSPVAEVSDACHSSLQAPLMTMEKSFSCYDVPSMEFVPEHEFHFFIMK